jgi:hypothetical protein
MRGLIVNVVIESNISCAMQGVMEVLRGHLPPSDFQNAQPAFVAVRVMIDGIHENLKQYLPTVPDIICPARSDCESIIEEEMHMLGVLVICCAFAYKIGEWRGKAY